MNTEMRASRGARIVTLCVVAFCVLNYILHNLGFVFFGREFANLVLPSGLRLEIGRMSATPRYAPFADAYASFLVAILFQIMISMTIFLTLIIRRVLVGLKAIPKLELESVRLLAGVFLVLVVMLTFIVPDSASIVFNENPRLGGKSIWIGTLFLACPLLIVLVALCGFLLFPAALNYHANFGGKDDNISK